MLIRLTPEQVAFADIMGRLRHKSHTGRPDPKVSRACSGINLHCQGARAELAVALALGLEWKRPVVPLEEWLKERPCDLPCGIQVRSTTFPGGRLLLRDSDRDTDRFVLVRCDSNGLEYRICGWIEGREAKSRDYWDNTLPRPCYAVPATSLRSIDNLPLKGIGAINC